MPAQKLVTVNERHIKAPRNTVLLGPHLTIISESYSQPELTKELAKSGKLEQTKKTDFQEMHVGVAA